MSDRDGLWDEIKARGIPYDHHESDLYIPVTSETRAIVHQYDRNRTATAFISQIDGKMWFDIPFGYLPWWEKRTGIRNSGPIRANPGGYTLSGLKKILVSVQESLDEALRVIEERGSAMNRYHDASEAVFSSVSEIKDAAVAASDYAWEFHGATGIDRDMREWRREKKRTEKQH